DVMSAVQPGGLGGTYAGNPLSVAAANAVLDVIAEEHLCERATEMGKRITERLHELSRRQGFECIGEVRELGAMVAMELVKDRTSRAPNPALADALLAEAQKRGLVLLSCGAHHNVIRILAPLTTPMAQIDEGLGILADALEASISSLQAAA
ncbi:MAG: aminotransferase class III-fold pyridoxal phosphate-dependent enzyme, partial [Acetobacteraceae bacterium]